MEVSKHDIQKIFDKLDQELHELQFQSNTSALIQISADYKDIKEVIQYFEAYIDTLKTQNESLKEILKESVREMCNVKAKMLDGIITRDELNEELTKITDKVFNVPEELPLQQRIKDFLNSAISPKMIVVAIAIIMLIGAFVFKPELTKDMLHELTPIVKSVSTK
jgi:uncharacterized UPF0160 family protein